MITKAAASLLISALLLVGCAGAAAPTSTAEPLTRIEVTLTDSLQIQPSSMTVSAGVPITFVVTNAGGIDHEFYLGDQAAQDAHEAEMAAMGGMTHDEPAGIAVKPGATKELVYTFASPGASMAGCHVPGHFPGGMKAAITVVE